MVGKKKISEPKHVKEHLGTVPETQETPRKSLESGLLGRAFMCLGEHLCTHCVDNLLCEEPVSVLLQAGWRWSSQ